MTFTSTATSSKKVKDSNSLEGNDNKRNEDVNSTNEKTHQELNPLLKLKSIAESYDLCDENGFNKANRHWTFAISIIDSSSHHTSNTSMVYAPEGKGNEFKGTASEEIMTKAPILRTVNFQRVSEKGIDFVMKNRGYASDLLFVKDQRMSFLYTLGKYLPGQTVQQWRAHGLCEPIRLKEIIDRVPNFTIVEMVASVRANKEGDSREDMDLSHFTEILQQTRGELDRGEVTMMELEEAVRAWRFIPCQIEQMVGGPEQIMWERHEWLHKEGKWIKPVRLMPF